MEQKRERDDGVTSIEQKLHSIVVIIITSQHRKKVKKLEQSAWDEHRKRVTYFKITTIIIQASALLSRLVCAEEQRYSTLPLLRYHHHHHHKPPTPQYIFSCLIAGCVWEEAHISQPSQQREKARYTLLLSYTFSSFNRSTGIDQCNVEVNHFNSLKHLCNFSMGCSVEAKTTKCSWCACTNAHVYGFIRITYLCVVPACLTESKKNQWNN